MVSCCLVAKSLSSSWVHEVDKKQAETLVDGLFGSSGELVKGSKAELAYVLS